AAATPGSAGRCISRSNHPKQECARAIGGVNVPVSATRLEVSFGARDMRNRWQWRRGPPGPTPNPFKLPIPRGRQLMQWPRGRPVGAPRGAMVNGNEAFESAPTTAPRPSDVPSFTGYDPDAPVPPPPLGLDSDDAFFGG